MPPSSAILSPPARALNSSSTAITTRAPSLSARRRLSRPPRHPWRVNRPLARPPFVVCSCCSRQFRRVRRPLARSISREGAGRLARHRGRRAGRPCLLPTWSAPWAPGLRGGEGGSPAGDAISPCAGPFPSAKHKAARTLRGRLKFSLARGLSRLPCRPLRLRRTTPNAHYTYDPLDQDSRLDSVVVKFFDCVLALVSPFKTGPFARLLLKLCSGVSTV